MSIPSPLLLLADTPSMVMVLLDTSVSPVYIAGRISPAVLIEGRVLDGDRVAADGVVNIGAVLSVIADVHAIQHYRAGMVVNLQPVVKTPYCCSPPHP